MHTPTSTPVSKNDLTSIPACLHNEPWSPEQLGKTLQGSVITNLANHYRSTDHLLISRDQCHLPLLLLHRMKRSQRLPLLDGECLVPSDQRAAKRGADT